MSSNLTWEPASRKQRTLSTELKFALRKRFGEPIDTVVSHSDIDYIVGLRDAGIDDAQDLIDAIEKYGQLELKEVY